MANQLVPFIQDEKKWTEHYMAQARKQIAATQVPQLKEFVQPEIVQPKFISPIAKLLAQAESELKHEQNERPVFTPTIYQHKGMLLQNLHHRYLYITIKLPHLSDLEQRIPNFRIVIITVLYIPVIQTHYWMIHQQMIMNYIRLSVILSKLITSKKWTLLLKYEID